jgi:hypothetical protein
MTVHGLRNEIVDPAIAEPVTALALRRIDNVSNIRLRGSNCRPQSFPH